MVQANKKKTRIACWLLLMLSPLVFAKMLSEIGEVHKPAIELIKGRWLVEDTGHMFTFTDRFARKLYGLDHYYYTPRHPRDGAYLYTIVKKYYSRILFFARGNYKDGKFTGSTSRIRFKNNDHIIIYKRDKPGQILFEAVRIVDKKTGKE